MQITNMFVDLANRTTPIPEATNNRHNTLLYEIVGFVLLVALLCVLCLIRRKCYDSSEDQISLYEINDETSNLVESGNMAVNQYRTTERAFPDILHRALPDDMLLFDSCNIVEYNKLHIERLIGIGM